MSVYAVFINSTQPKSATNSRCKNIKIISIQRWRIIKSGWCTYILNYEFIHQIQTNRVLGKTQKYGLVAVEDPETLSNCMLSNRLDSSSALLYHFGIRL